jgi:hypothetical protein
LIAGEVGVSARAEVSVSWPPPLALLTVTETAPLVVVVFAVLRARAANVCVPLASVVVLNGAL